MSFCPAWLQDVLEKFEFFPIKCRIQRAAEMYGKVVERRQPGKHRDGRPLKAKVAAARTKSPWPYASTQYTNESSTFRGINQIACVGKWEIQDGAYKLGKWFLTLNLDWRHKFWCMERQHSSKSIQSVWFVWYQYNEIAGKYFNVFTILWCSYHHVLSKNINYVLNFCLVCKSCIMNDQVLPFVCVSSAYWFNLIIFQQLYMYIAL